MRFTRAAKVAAFPLTALILVALVACQGPAGPAGAPGGKGDPGTMGTPGTSGAPGISPIVNTGKTPEVILLNHTLLEGLATLGSAKAVVDVTGYFRGGKEAVTYAIVTKPAATFTAELDPATGQLTVKAVAPSALVEEIMYTDGEMVVIKAIDADKIAAAENVELTIKANKAPTTGPAIVLTVGTQNAKDALRDGRNNKTDTVLDSQPNPVCATFASCVFNVKLQDGGANQLTGPFHATLTRSTEAADSEIGSVIVIMDADTAGMMFSIVEYDEKLVQASASKNKITIGGVKSTIVAGAHKATAVKIMATDANGLPVKRIIMVQVDAAPTLSKKFLFLRQYEITVTGTAGDPQAVTPRDLGDYFDDMESDAELTYAITSSNHAIAKPPAADDVVVGTASLMMTLGQGPAATVTITATDPRGQAVKAEFVVKVNPAA